jgi:EamA domain-containing membrane protein RarD
MDALTKLDNVISQLQQHAATIGITVAGLMVGIYAMIIMFNLTNNPMTIDQNWKGLTRVLICAGIITATFTFVQFSQSLGKML